MKKQVERTFCDWTDCQREASERTSCALCMGDFCGNHLVRYSQSGDMHDGSKERPYFLVFCRGCFRHLTPEGILSNQKRVDLGH